MARVDRERMTIIWLAMTSWHGFRRTIKDVGDTMSDWMDPLLADTLVQASHELENAGQPFPDDPDKLAEVLNAHIAGRDEAA